MTSREGGSTAYLFPGQGSQYVGMGADLCAAFPAARQTFAQADRVLGFSLSRLCAEGPEDELRDTAVTQPAIFTHSIAAYRVLLGGEPRDAASGRAATAWPERLGPGPSAAGAYSAGHSLGEYSAYVAAGALEFEDGLRLVRRRGELMGDASRARPGAMAAVLGLTGPQVVDLLRSVEGVVRAANLNSPGQVVISGEVAAVESAMEKARAAGAKRVVRLEVGGAFHSPLMEAAAAGLAATLQSTQMRTPTGVVVANESAAPVSGGVDEIRTSLARQLLSAVRWEETIRSLLQHGVTRFVEIGPGKVLIGLARATAKVEAERQTLRGELEFVALGDTEQLRTALAI